MQLNWVESANLIEMPSLVTCVNEYYCGTSYYPYSKSLVTPSL
ncbi:hypothetical protein [Vibrio gallaecicus]|nr:hypothetical protein [Vibrio gallaecicus]MDN3615168.1 hypothetical protein [Vibrio gallaecicus]